MSNDKLPESTSSQETSPSWFATSWYWYLLSGSIILADQISKRILDQRLDYGRSVELLPVLDLTLLYNRGAAFSFLSNAGGWQRWLFTVIASVVSVVLAVWLARVGNRQKWLSAALALILGGAIGNLIDRVQLGYVIDFIHVHWQHHYFPAFNIADSAISVGAVLLFVDMFVESKKSNARQ